MKWLLPFLMASPVVGQSLSPCEGIISTPAPMHLGGDNSRLFDYGDVQLALIDTGVSVLDLMHFLGLPSSELGESQCCIIGLIIHTGGVIGNFGNLVVDYDPAVQLLFDFSVTLMPPCGRSFNSVLISFAPYQSNESITKDLKVATG